jgi:hypothetical protein
MKNKLRFLLPCVAIIVFGSLRGVAATEKESEWVRIPSQWLLHRFVRASTAPAHTYKVALAFPAGAHQAVVAKSSGNSSVDELAGDFALESIRKSGPLKDLAKSKELYFQFVVTPPMLDVKMRSKEGQRPMPPGEEFYTPSANFYVNPNQTEPTSRRGKLVVIFPPQGGYASEALVTVSTGNPAVDRYYLHSAALNWQTSSKSSQEQILRTTFGVVTPPRWQSILDR